MRRSHFKFFAGLAMLLLAAVAWWFLRPPSSGGRFNPSAKTPTATGMDRAPGRADSINTTKAASPSAVRACFAERYF
jgi:hypothetical protein